MRGTSKRMDPLPAEFKSQEEASDFWDTHSVTDYEEYLEPVELQVDLKGRHYEIEVDEECFFALRESAKKEHKPVKRLASEILKHGLGVG